MRARAGGSGLGAELAAGVQQTREADEILDRQRFRAQSRIDAILAIKP